jgi:hypothetical protein
MKELLIAILSAAALTFIVMAVRKSYWRVLDTFATAVQSGRAKVYRTRESNPEDDDEIYTVLIGKTDESGFTFKEYFLDDGQKAYRLDISLFTDSRRSGGYAFGNDFGRLNKKTQDRLAELFTQIRRI